MSVFQLGAIRLLTLAHGQASIDTSYNAWYDSTGAHNGPHGNTYNLADYDHRESTWISGAEDSGYTSKGLTGSCNVFARSTHNGQNCGIADLKGIVYQVVTGAIATLTQSNSFGTRTIYMLKEETAIGDLDADAMYNTTNHNTITFNVSGYPTDEWYWDSTRPMMTNARDGFEYQCCGFLPAERSVDPTDMFEYDFAYTRILSNMFPHFGCNWDNGSLHGLWYGLLNVNRSSGDSDCGFRACAY